MKTLVYSYAWVEIFKASAAGEVAKERIESSDEAFTPDVIPAELTTKYLRAGEGQSSIRNWLSLTNGATEVLGINIPVAEESARASLDLTKRAKERGLSKPGLADEIVLATACIKQAEVLTGDPHSKGLSGVVWLGM
ncbi:MAG: PIN domain-containing protein [archaeon]|nr:MAG: PIN domain-containing protein [archaeon]